MLNKWLKIFVVILSIVGMILWALNYQINKETIQKNSFNSYSLIEKLMKANNNIDENILKSTLYNMYNNDHINKNIELSSKIFKDIQNSAIFTTKNYPETKASLNNCLSHSMNRIKNIEMFKRKNGQVKNSITFITSNLDKLDNISKKNQKKLLNVVSKIYSIKNSMELTSKAKINLNLDLDSLNTDYIRNDQEKMFIQLYKIHIKQLNKNLPILINITDKVLNDKYREEQFIKLKHSIEMENHLANEKLDDEFYAIIIFTLITLMIIIYYIFLSESEKNRIIKLQNDYKQSVTVDKTTGLKNRNAYIDELTHFDDVTVVLLDIAEFSSINSLYGLNAGDFILKSVANKINDFLDSNKNANIYKVGADQFIILLSKSSDEEAFTIAENLIIAIENTPFKYDHIDQPIFLQMQSGISSKSPYLINSAIALKTVIGDYSKKIGIYNDSLDKTQEIEKNILMVQKVKHCISNDHVTMLFQPLVDLKSKDTIKHEALVRLKDKDEYISPYFFLELSKKVKLYTQITHEVIIKSLKAIKEKDVDISINLSIEDILHKETHDFIIKTLASDIQVANRVTLELLESEEIQDFKALKDFIKKVKSFGCKIAIDDFGSGYSNYNYLLELDVDILKIDGSLIKNIDKSENNQLVVKSIVEFAKLANIKTVAEFVENKEIEKVITELGIDYGQGYYYSAPKLL